MRRQKRGLRPLELWNPGASEKWLEDEAAKGWQLTDCGRMLAVFKVIEPGTYRVRLRPQRPETPEARRERGVAWREMGWDCTAVIMGDDDYDCEVFYCGDPAVPELDTDPVAYGWAWEKPLRHSWRMAWVMLGLLAVLPLVLSVLAPGRSMLEVLLRQNLFWLLWLVVAVLLGIVMLRRLWYLRRMRRELAAGMVPDPGSWQRDRRWQQAVIVLLLLFWFLWWFSSTVPFLQREPDIGSLPYTAPVELMEGTDKAYWEFEVDNYLYRSTPLAPDRFSIQYRGEQGEHVRNAADRLRFEALAKALYRERAADFRKDHPDAEETTVENDAFDQAVLLAEGDCQLFLARSGKVVCALWVDFPTDLDSAIEAVADSLAE